MDLDWSEQSPHIRSLYAPWQPEDGYEDDVIAAAEARCGVRLPATLRSFYGVWGRRHDLTRMNECLLPPDAWVVHSNALIFCVENQACAYWALPLEALEGADPPILEADSGPEMSLRELTVDLAWRTRRQHVSAFLDDLTYTHAFSRGALNGAWSGPTYPEPWQVETLERDWRKATYMSMQLRSTAVNDPAVDGWLGSPLYVRDGQAIEWFHNFFAVANSEEALDEMAQALAIEWEERW